MKISKMGSYLPDEANAEQDYVDQFFVAAGTISAGDFVMIDLSTTTMGVGRHVIRTAAAVSAAAKCVGVALEAVVSGQMVRVRCHGTVEDANLADAVVAGDPLNVGTVAGRAITGVLGAADTGRIGFALTGGSASNRGSVFLQCL